MQRAPKWIFPAVMFLMLSAGTTWALYPASYVASSNQPGAFPLVAQGAGAGLETDPADYPGVLRAAGDLREDIRRVTGVDASLVTEPVPHSIIIGTIGHSKLIDQFISEKKLDVSPIAGKWESFLIQTVSKPAPGMDDALVIAGSDKRGTIYGIYDLSEQIGVSPWYWWADVPPQHHDSLFVKRGRYVQGPPAVQYRGIFLNDEAPALSGWAQEKFGGLNHKFYAKVFELLLRLRANYLWPAMWNNCFSEDDPLNPKLADEYGIVMGTSHVEPMMRADKEWERAGFTQKQWNYEKYPRLLDAFWRAGLERNKPYENIITIGMRGKIDTPMSETANIALLEKIVANQRKIIAQVINPDVANVPQLWCLYKEVQEYYEKGMRVPDDVTLLWSDDNWGDIRRLPTPDERKRSGGAGIYYHFDYVGGPRNYKWIDTNPIPKIWEQMNLAHAYGANKIWIVNVGDLKPMEFPIDFFLSMAWNPDAWPKEKLGEFTRLWCDQQFHSEIAARVWHSHAEYIQGIARIISWSLEINGWRKPELLDLPAYSLINYGEADKLVDWYKAIMWEAEIYSLSLPVELQPAFFELVFHPAKSYEQVLALYVAAEKNHLYAGQKRASANYWADQVEKLFAADQALTDQYNHALLNGKWDHMMDQTHIGYTNWQEPPRNIMPKFIRLDVPAAASMGVAVEGSASAWPGSAEAPVLPEINVYKRGIRTIEVFNRGKTPFDYSATGVEPWLSVGPKHGTVDADQEIFVSANWAKAPPGRSIGQVRVSSSAGAPVDIAIPVFNPIEPARRVSGVSLDDNPFNYFLETSGYVSMLAQHYTHKIDTAAARWERIPGYGRELAGANEAAMSIFPVTAASILPPANAPALEYKMYLFQPGNADISILIAPTQAFVPGRGLRLAVSMDNQSREIIDTLAQNTEQDWERSVENSIRTVAWNSTIKAPGYHTLKIWMVDPGIVLEKILVDMGGLKPSYLGPPESYHQ